MSGSQSFGCLYRNSQTPLDGTTSGAAYAFPGAALTANTLKKFASAKPLYARWVLAWNPNTPAGGATSVRLCHADSGPENIIEIARFERRATATPVVDAVDITNALNALTTDKFILHQTYGNGMNRCKIYLSEIEFLWP